eukprot:CAMPEP_0194346304 /NCGR_PEP_ID=MMETSP0171-20130528/105351_1 /TAXON_ID=218684 /ORGANISM="Corethron pennatum, Strain L29A3" /LENGTH=193 /DNA_ID=CAMNT_0039113409 /DNA_START=434 /DNA_END=1016 /DNA_ORIENTATION=+
MRGDGGSAVVDEAEAQENFLQFYENMFTELGKFGRIDDLNVCDNLGDHMVGHVYVKFSDEEEAADALQVMSGRYYDGRTMECEYSPVTDFREARCRDFDEDTCARGGFCNFMHIKHVPMDLVRSLQDDVEEERRREIVRELDLGRVAGVRDPGAPTQAVAGVAAGRDGGAEARGGGGRSPNLSRYLGPGRGRF